MASKIKIKRSGVAGNPTTLAVGELAYSWFGGSGGDRLYIGTGLETLGDAANHTVIGGKFFTDRLDHTAGILTASKALVVDSDSKLNDLLVDNLELNGNTISTTDANGNLILSPNGTGKVSIAGVYTLPRVDGSTGYVLTTNGSGVVSWAAPATSLSIAGDTGTDSLALLSDTLTFAGGEGVDVAVTNNTVTISSEDATSTNKGVASFSSSYFSVTSGAVSLDTTGVTAGSYGSTTKIPTFTVDSVGRLSAAGEVDVATNLSIAGNTGTDTVSLLSDTLTVSGSGAISSAVTDNTITISAADASTSTKGVASFNSTNFSVSSGAVTINDEYVQDTVGAMVGSNSESNITVTYDDTNGKLDFAVATATTSTLGVASFNSTDFTVTSGAVELHAQASVTANTYGSTTAIPVVTVNSKGVVTNITTASISTTLTIAGDTGGTDAVSLASDTLTVAGSGSIHTATTNNTITVSVDTATTSTKGVASFDSNTFTLTAGYVEVSAGGITNTQLANSTVTVGSTIIDLGGTASALSGLTQLDVDNLEFNGNTISSTNTNGNIVLAPNGTGYISANSAQIKNLAEPVDDSDAATKYYVDAARSGLDVKASVKVATVSNITLSNTQTIDGIAVSVGDRVLVKDQTDAKQNGIYVVASGAWDRAADLNSPGEVSGGTFVFVEQGTINSDTGFVVTSDGSLTIGTDNIVWTLFSTSGTLIAGNGLSKNGYTLEVNVAGSGGLEISADNLQLKSTVAGAGLTLSSGVLDIGGTTDRITINADSIDISANYAGQSSIATVGTITTGTWNGTTIGSGYGGTGFSTYAKGDIIYASGANTLSKLTAATDGQVLLLDNGVPVWADLDGGTY